MNTCTHTQTHTDVPVGNCYCKSTFKSKLAKIVTLNRKSEEIITSNVLLSQNWQNHFFKQDI